MRRHVTGHRRFPLRQDGDESLSTEINASLPPKGLRLKYADLTVKVSTDPKAVIRAQESSNA